MNENEIIRQYYLKFSQISYRGTSGRGFNILWNYMEMPHKQKHYENVLELGSTHLEHLKYLKHSFNTFYATDLYPHVVDSEAKKIIECLPVTSEVKIEIADAMQLPYSDEFFDRTLTTCLFHHLSKPEVAMEEMLRVTKSGGVISFFLPYDPGILFNFVRSLTTRRNAKRLFIAGEISNPKLIWALEHRNHIEGIRILINEVFKGHEVKVRHIPPFVKSSSFGIAEFYDIRKT
jgi:SAM-dependent methyltransferase